LLDEARAERARNESRSEPQTPLRPRRRLRDHMIGLLPGGARHRFDSTPKFVRQRRQLLRRECLAIRQARRAQQFDAFPQIGRLGERLFDRCRFGCAEFAIGIRDQLAVVGFH
jgi:hypothetical protein